MATDAELVGAYPFGWIWPDEKSDLMKCLIPFFDGLAIFMPAKLVDQVVDRDPYLARPLFERGYLRNIDPDKTLDKDLSNRILRMVKQLLEDERFTLGQDYFHMQDNPYPHLRRSIRHLGYEANPKAVLDFLQDLEVYGCTGDATEDETFAAQSSVCAGILQSCFFALSQKLRLSGIELAPIDASDTPYPDRPWEPIDSLMPDIFKFELKEVGVDLRAVPLDEIFDFSSRYRPQYRAYLRGIREAPSALYYVHDKDEVDRAIRDRLEMLTEQRDFYRDVLVRNFAAALSLCW